MSVEARVLTRTVAAEDSRPYTKIAAARPAVAPYLIRLVFFLDRLGAAHFCFFAGGTFLGAVRLLSFVNFLENIRDHRRRGAAAVHGAANVAFVERSEREPWLIGR